MTVIMPVSGGGVKLTPGATVVGHGSTFAEKLANAGPAGDVGAGVFGAVFGDVFGAVFGDVDGLARVDVGLLAVVAVVAGAVFAVVVAPVVPAVLADGVTAGVEAVVLPGVDTVVSFVAVDDTLLLHAANPSARQPNRAMARIFVIRSPPGAP